MCFHNRAGYKCSHYMWGAVAKFCPENTSQTEEGCPQTLLHPLYTVNIQEDCSACQAAKKRLEVRQADMKAKLSRAQELTREIRIKLERISVKNQSSHLAIEPPSKKESASESPFFDAVDPKVEADETYSDFEEMWNTGKDLEEQLEPKDGTSSVTPIQNSTYLMTKDDRYVNGTYIESSAWAEGLRATLKNSKRSSEAHQPGHLGI